MTEPRLANAGIVRPEETSSAEKDSPYPVQTCEVCDTKMYGLHCKIICPNCGYKRDCSDP